MSKAALKNKKKREAAKKARAEAEAVAASDSREGGRDELLAPGGGTRSRSRNGQPNGRGRSKSHGRDGPPKDAQAGPNKAPTPPQQPPTPPTPQITAEDAAQDEKKVRGLLKKLRAIEELKLRLAKGEKLEDTQLKKIKTEDGVRKELEALGADP